MFGVEPWGLELSSSRPETTTKGLLTHRDSFWLCGRRGDLAGAASVAAAQSLSGLLGCALALIAARIAIVDRRHFIIPDALNGIAFLLGLCNAAIAGAPDVTNAISQAIVRGVCVAFVFLSIRYVYSLLRRREGIGFGDVKLAGVAGVWLSWTLIPVAVDIAAFVALGTYLLLRAGRFSFGQSRRQLNCRSVFSLRRRFGCAGFCSSFILLTAPFDRKHLTLDQLARFPIGWNHPID